jgi:hypothetical protein
MLTDNSVDLADKRNNTYFYKTRASSFLAPNFYKLKLPYNIDIFSNIKENNIAIDDSNIIDSINKVLLKLYIILFNISYKYKIDNYLPRIHLVQQDDKSALIEWNFQDFRVGFGIETSEEDCYYFIVMGDKNKQSIETITQKIDINNYEFFIKLITFILVRT